MIKKVESTNFSVEMNSGAKAFWLKYSDDVHWLVNRDDVEELISILSLFKPSK